MVLQLKGVNKSDEKCMCISRIKNIESWEGTFLEVEEMGNANNFERENKPILYLRGCP